MSLTESIFKIHNYMRLKSDQKTADEYIKLLVNEKISELQEKGIFTPVNLETTLEVEAQGFSSWENKESIG